MPDNAADVRTIPARVHGRYLVVHREGAGPVPTLVGFHGYAETAEAHLAELRRIPGSEAWRLVSVQALHPFYTRTQEVVASWMTRLDRELAIADNVEYVRAVVREVAAARGASPLVYAGFSQGVAMAYRAAADSAPGHARCHGVLALGGDVPPDLAAADGRTPLPPVLIGRGARDAWYTDEKLRADVSTLRARGVEVTAVTLDAGHEWTEEFRVAAGTFLRTLREP